MKKNVFTTCFTASIVVFIIFMAITFFAKNSLAVTLVVDQNLGEIASYDFAFFPITETILSFDFNFTTIVDPSDPSDPWMWDSFSCDIQIDADLYSLLTVDKALGNVPDPWGTAPGTVAITPSSAPGYSHSLTADISALSGLAGNLHFELCDWGVDPTTWTPSGWPGDGYDTTVEFANIAGVTPVPEPATLFLLSLSLLGLAVLRKRH